MTFFLLHSFHAAFFQCCNLFMFLYSCVALYSCCTFFIFQSFPFTLLSCLSFTCCTTFMLLFLLHSFQVALFLRYRFAFLFWKWKVQSELPMHYLNFTLLTVNFFSEKVFLIKLWSSRFFQVLYNVETLLNHLLQDSPAFFSNIKTECFSFANMLE